MSKSFDPATTEKVFREYQARFPEAWLSPPLDYGHGVCTLAEIAQLARVALKEGKPIDWSRYCAPLPDGAVS